MSKSYNNETATKKYVPEKVVSETFSIGLQTLRNDRFLGRGFPYSKIGKSVRYDLEECFAIVEKSKVATSPFPAEGER